MRVDFSICGQLLRMGTSKSSQATVFSMAVNEEIRSLMGRRGMSQTALSLSTGISQSKISKTIWKDDGSLTINQLEVICEVLGVTPSRLIERAERATYFATQNQHALAASADRGQAADVNEEDYF